LLKTRDTPDTTKRAPGQGGNRALYWLREERGVAGETAPPAEPLRFRPSSLESGEPLAGSQPRQTHGCYVFGAWRGGTAQESSIVGRRRLIFRQLSCLLWRQIGGKPCFCLLMAPPTHPARSLKGGSGGTCARSLATNQPWSRFRPPDLGGVPHRNGPLEFNGDQR
jgi:hypothetical protein